jgi:alkaline phosphatase
MVPVYLYGTGAESINGVMDNTELAKQLMSLMGWE